MSLEVLKIIILACQVSGGGESFLGVYSWELVDQHQVECQVEMIKCYEASTSARAAYAVRNCLVKRKKRR